MQVVFDKQSGIVLHAGDVRFDETSLVGANWRDPSCTPENCEIVNAPEVTEFIIGGWARGQDGSFSLTTQGAAEVAARDAEKLLQQREQLKAQRAATVAALKVTTAAGHTYDADELSIQRLNTAVNVTGITGQTVPWVLADNTVIVATQAELAEALCLAAAAVAAIWVIE